MTSKQFLRFATLAAFALPVFAIAQNPHVQEEFQRGALALRNGRNADAEKAFRDAVRLAPDMAEAHLDLGLVLGREGKLDEAIPSLQTALKLDPKLGSAHMFLGIFLHQANRQDEARVELEREVTENPNNPEALMWLGMVELAQGRPDRAVGPLDKATELTPNDLNLLELRGQAHSLVARDSYALMAKLDPENWHVHRVRAHLFSDEGRHAEAIAEYQAAIKLQDRNPDLYEGLGDEYRKTNELDSAQKAYAKEVELSPANPIALYDLGSTDVERGDAVAGVPLLLAMIKSYQHSPVAEYYLGRGFASQGQDDEAIQWLEKSASEDHGGEVSKRSWYELARIYRKLQRTSDVQRAMQEYSRLRQTEENKNAQQVQDWRKLQGATTAPTTPSN